MSWTRILDVTQLMVENKFAVHLACGHVIVIDKTVESPFRYLPSSKVDKSVNCLACGVVNRPR